MCAFGLVTFLPSGRKRKKEEEGREGSSKEPG